MIDDFDWCENTTPQVGPTPDSVLLPDDVHIIRVLAGRKPDIVVACGKQAEMALTRIWPGPLLIVPHPAHRVLTDALYVKARRLLELKDTIPLRTVKLEARRLKVACPEVVKLDHGRMALRQGRGRIVPEVFSIITSPVTRPLSLSGEGTFNLLHFPEEA